MWGHLPQEIIRMILGYDGRFKHRNCTYWDQISPDDSRYELIRTIATPKLLYLTPNTFCIMISFADTRRCLVIQHGSNGSIQYEFWWPDILLLKYRRSVRYITL